MQMRTLAVAVVLLLANVDPARSAPLVYEPFDYEDGTGLDDVAATGLNLTGDYVSYALEPTDQQTVWVESPGLGFGNLGDAPSAEGNRAGDPFGGVGSSATAEVDEDVSVGNGEEIYWSVLFTYDDSQDPSHVANVSLDDASTGGAITFGQSAVVTRSVQLGVDTATAFRTDIIGEAFEDGDTLFYVGRYVNSGSPGGDTMDMLVYDTADSITLPETFDLQDPNAIAVLGLSDLDIDLPVISAVSFYLRGEDNFVDELRVGRTYADVVPEPSAGAGLLAVLAAPVAMRRLRARHGPTRRP